MAFVTDPNLLADIKKGDNAAWNLFAKKYGALIWLRGSDYHLTPDEQEQLTQDVLVSFFKAQDNFEYAPEKGRFRDYLRQIIKNCIFQILRKRQQDSNNEEIQENTAFDENDDEAKQKREDEEWMAHIYSQALAELKRTVKPRKLQSFMMCRLQNKRPEDVAKFQKVSLATIYNDCNEVMEKLTELVKTLKDA